MAFAYNFMDMRLSDSVYAERLASNVFHYEPEFNYYEVEDRQMRYVEMGNDDLPLVMFVHGAPSSSAFWDGILQDSVLLSHAKVLAVDRPGYGYSGYAKPVTSVKKQAAMLAPILKKKRKKHKKIILHGSSYGGTLVARLAMDFPELIDGIVLQSASVAPGLEKTYWISYPTSHPLLKWLVPGPLQVANAEKLSHREQLEAMAPLWKNIDDPAIILHGGIDELIYPENAYYAYDKLKKAGAPLVELIMDPERQHDLLWNRRDLIIGSILKLVDR
jgi:pimeloyl-ACP methyl ester carboxylesterase